MGSKVKIPKTTQALRENQLFSQENTCWRDLLIRFIQAESLEQVPEVTTEQHASSQRHAAPCAALLLQSYSDGEITDKGCPQPEPRSSPQEAGIFRGDDKAPTEGALTALAL